MKPIRKGGCGPPGVANEATPHVLVFLECICFGFCVLVQGTHGPGQPGHSKVRGSVMNRSARRVRVEPRAAMDLLGRAPRPPRATRIRPLGRFAVKHAASAEDSGDPRSNQGGGPWPPSLARPQHTHCVQDGNEWSAHLFGGGRPSRRWRSVEMPGPMGSRSRPVHAPGAGDCVGWCGAGSRMRYEGLDPCAGARVRPLWGPYLLPRALA